MAAIHDNRLPASPRHQRNALLVLDDDPTSCELIAAAAESVGFQVQMASDVPAFLQAYDAWQPSHVTLDVHLRSADGIQVIQALVQRQCRAAVTIVSATERRIREAVGKVAHQEGLRVSGVLEKPIDYRRLEAVLRPKAAASEMPGRPGSDDAYTADSEELHSALMHGEFLPYYQPQVSLRDGRLTGVEALARWRHPRRGILLPGAFLHGIEAMGVMRQFTKQILDQALAWLACGGLPAGVVLSVNISPSELSDPEFVDDMLLRCREHGVSPRRLMLEITESMAVQDQAVALATLTRLRIHGFMLAIDDIGNAFSSLSRLLQQPLSCVKLDHSLVSIVGDSREAREVVAAMLRLGASLGMQTVAEGVESSAIARWLRDMGCTKAQGTGIAAPMAGEGCAQWARSWNPAELMAAIDAYSLPPIPHGGAGRA